MSGMTRTQLEKFIWQQIPKADPRAVAEILRAADSYRLHSPWPLHPDPVIQGRRDALESALSRRAGRPQTDERPRAHTSGTPRDSGPQNREAAS